MGQAILPAAGILTGFDLAGWKAGCGQDCPPHSLRSLLRHGRHRRPVEHRLCLRIEKYPKTIDPERCSERNMDKIERRKDDQSNASPGLLLHQSDAAHQARKSHNQAKNAREYADGHQYRYSDR